MLMVESLLVVITSPSPLSLDGFHTTYLLDLGLLLILTSEPLAGDGERLLMVHVWSGAERTPLIGGLSASSPFPSLYSRAAYSFLEVMDCATLGRSEVGWSPSSSLSSLFGPMLKAVVFLVIVPELDIGMWDVFGCPCTGLVRGLAGRKGPGAFLLPVGGASSSSS